MEKSLKLHSNEEAIAIYGSLDKNLSFAEAEYDVRVSARNHRLKIIGEKDNVEMAIHFFQGLIDEYRGVVKKTKAKKSKAEEDGEKTHSIKSKGSHKSSAPDPEVGKAYFKHKEIIRAKTKTQRKYLEAVLNTDIVFGIGPAGTGKTYLAMAAAVEYLKKNYVSRIILTRPAVEAGESLGFLPGDLQAKVNPYLRPLYDALYDMLEFDDCTRFIERGVIEVAPLAYMRGRTLNDAFVILDEAQNTTHAQMKMFLTRLGESSKAVITGDITQVDLPPGMTSGLVEAKKILSRVQGIEFVQFEKTDVVRHPLVKKIIEAYEKNEKKR